MNETIDRYRVDRRCQMLLRLARVSIVKYLDKRLGQHLDGTKNCTFFIVMGDTYSYTYLWAKDKRIQL